MEGTGSSLPQRASGSSAPDAHANGAAAHLRLALGCHEGQVIFAAGAWVAIDRGAVCEALSRSLRVASRDETQAVAGFSFTADRRRWGEFHARLSRPPREGASVMLTVGKQPFLLVSRGDWAWSSSNLQQQGIIAAARDATGMSIESRDRSGRRFSDPYMLDGAPTAIDAAAARCALRGAGKIR
jgi:hypothetical protein